MTLLIWTYSSTLDGPENVLWDYEDDNKEYDSVESKKRENIKKEERRTPNEIYPSRKF